MLAIFMHGGVQRTPDSPARRRCAETQADAWIQRLSKLWDEGVEMKIDNFIRLNFYGPSNSAFRRRVQTTWRCIGQKPVYRAAKKVSVRGSEVESKETSESKSSFEAS